MKVKSGQFKYGPFLPTFLGLPGYYRRFVKGFAAMAWPPTQLMKKNAPGWSKAAKTAFEAL